MRLKKKISRQSKIFKKAINAKWAFYWAKFMTEAATICRKYTHEVIEGKGTDHLKEATKDNCFRISYWQCCNKPAYTMREIKMDGRIRLFGCGSWNGYYGSDVRIDSTDLKDIHQPDELFIDPRYESRW